MGTHLMKTEAEIGGPPIKIANNHWKLGEKTRRDSLSN